LGPGYRAVRLLPEQLKQVWDLVRYGVAQSIPPHVKKSQESMRRVLASLLADRAQCWILYQVGEDGQAQIGSMLVSAMEVERVSGTKFLNLWAMYGFRHTPMEGWQVMRDTVMAFARDQGCHCITAMSANPKAVELALGLGGQGVTFLTLEV